MMDDDEEEEERRSVSPKHPFGIPTIYETIPEVQEIKQNLFGKSKRRKK